MRCGIYGCELVNNLLFADDICVFSPSISGLQCLLNICGDYATEHEITFNCNKTIVLFCPKTYKQRAPSNVFLNGVRVQFLDQVKYLGVWINASLKDDDDIQRQVKSLYCAANKLRGTFDQCSPAVKILYVVPVACQCMLANCGANTHRPLWRAYVLRTTMPTELCLTYHETQVFAHTKSTIVSGHLMPCWETICIDFLYDAHLHPTFLFVCFKCLMLSTYFHFSSKLLYDGDQLQ